MECDVFTANELDAIMTMATHMALNPDSEMTKDFKAFNEMIDSCIDNLGMTEDEVNEYIGQIAFSGATDFITKYKDRTFWSIFCKQCSYY